MFAKHHQEQREKQRALCCWPRLPAVSTSLADWKQQGGRCETQLCVLSASVGSSLCLWINDHRWLSALARVGAAHSHPEREARSTCTLHNPAWSSVLWAEAPRKAVSCCWVTGQLEAAPRAECAQSGNQPCRCCLGNGVTLPSALVFTLGGGWQAVVSGPCCTLPGGHRSPVVFVTGPRGGGQPTLQVGEQLAGACLTWGQAVMWEGPGSLAGGEQSLLLWAMWVGRRRLL